jgi:hypothetical protein
VATVLVLAGHEPAAESACAGFLASHSDAIAVDPVPGPPDALFARMCAAITRLAPPPPLVIVAIGSAALALPSVALAQRSAHRRTVEYLLIEPSVPTVSDTWPDAPVTVACDDRADDASVQGRLRGWTVVTTSQLADWRPQHELS